MRGAAYVVRPVITLYSYRQRFERLEETVGRSKHTMMEKETPKLCSMLQSRFRSCLYPISASLCSSVTSMLDFGASMVANVFSRMQCLLI